MPTLAVGVDEPEVDGFVRNALSSFGADRFLAKRLASHREPLLPFSVTLRFTLSEQQQPITQRAASVLRLQQTQVDSSHWRCAALTPLAR